ncbi:MAG: hypothetical protein C5B47_06815 [Verrucomicrobia bacterium]|nr:MAG: hypothetical protein C5B47_06815 [Verrucomicrobiota bacterium]
MPLSKTSTGTPPTSTPAVSPPLSPATPENSPANPIVFRPTNSATGRVFHFQESAGSSSESFTEAVVSTTLPQQSSVSKEAHLGLTQLPCNFSDCVQQAIEAERELLGIKQVPQGILELNIQKPNDKINISNLGPHYIADKDSVPYALVTSTFNYFFPNENRQNNHTNSLNLVQQLGCNTPKALFINQPLQQNLESSLTELAEGGKKPSYFMMLLSCPIVITENPAFPFGQVTLCDNSDHPPELKKFLETLKFASFEPDDPQSTFNGILHKVPKLLILQLEGQPALLGYTKEDIKALSSDEQENLKKKIKDAYAKTRQACAFSVPSHLDDTFIITMPVPEDINPQAFHNSICKTIAKYAHQPYADWHTLDIMIRQELENNYNFLHAHPNTTFQMTGHSHFYASKLEGYMI